MIVIRTPDRLRPTLRQYFSLTWWLTDEKIDPGWSTKGCGWRNPLANAFHVIIGVNHLPRLTVTTNGIDTYPKSGIQFGLTTTFRFWSTVPVVLPMLSWRMLGWESCTGWKMNGAFTLLSFRREHSKNATDVRPT